MKLTAQIIIIFVCIINEINAQWEKISIQNTNEDLYKIEFLPNSNIGFIVGQGVILRTTDGGINWEKKVVCLNNQYNQSIRIYDFYFINDIGYFIGENGTILKTNNLGDSWNQLDIQTKETLKSIFFLNDSLGWICGGEGTILYSRDSGESWEIRTLKGDFYLFNVIKFFSKDHGLIFGSVRDPGSASAVASILIIDEELNWEYVYWGEYASALNEACFLSEKEFYAVGGRETVLRSINSGYDWLMIHNNESFSYETYSSITSSIDSVIWFCDYSGNIYRSNNKFESFFVDTTVNVALNDIAVKDTCIWIVGSLGTLYKYIHVPRANITENKINEFKFYLKQNYPNPFNSTTTIEFQIPENDHIELKVFNILGELVTTLLDKPINSGVCSIKFDSNNLATGIYFYLLETRNYSQIRKMVILN